MQSFRILDGQARYLVAAVALLIATLVAAIMPVVAGAEQVTQRSIALSSSAANAEDVDYTIKFTPQNAAEEVVIDFCDNSPLIGAACTPPVGLDLDSATAAGFTKDAASSDSTFIGTGGTIAANTEKTIVLEGVHNPTNTGDFYARILTFAENGAASYTSVAPGSYVDDGGVALYIVETIGVSAAVLESLTFCVSGAAIPDPNCGTAITPPTLKLGADTGNGVVALDSALVYTGNVYTQLSTNAARGAIVSLKSSAAGCGGLLRAGSQTVAQRCNIAPALATDITAAQAKFGVRTATAAGVGTSNGLLQPYGTAASSPYYSNSVYKMNYISGDGTGVTSPYGDPFLETAGAPVSNMGMTLTFGASAANDTPAGLYSADINLVATGTF